MAKVYGIDLGTTYSVITTLDEHGMPVVIRNEAEGTDLLASAVYFQEGGDPVIGEVAKAQADFEPERVVQFVKRYIGKEDAPVYEIDGVKYDPITISSLILKRLKTYADEQGENVENVVITCPAYFGNAEKAATKQTGIIAGLNVLNIVHEPTAAALNYCLHEYQENRKVMVYDLGGGTFDITLFDFTVDESGKATIDVIKTGGNDRLGGIDWDQRMFEYMCSKYTAETGVMEEDMSPELRAVIRQQAESVKTALSSLVKKTCSINYGGDHVRLDLTREEFESLTADLVLQTLNFVEQLLSDVGMTPDQVDTVLLVGGSTLMPMIKNAVEGMFPGRVRVEQPNLAVAKGAALSAALEWNEIMKRLAESEPAAAEPDGTAAEDGISYGDIRPASALSEMVPVSENIAAVKDKLTRSLGPAIFNKEDKYMIHNLLFVGDDISAEAEACYGTRVENAEEIVVVVYENISEDRDYPYVTPCFDVDGNPQATDPQMRVKKIGEVHLQLPPNTPKGSIIRVIFRSGTTGLEVTAVNEATKESAKVFIESDVNYSEDQLADAANFVAGIEVSGEL